MKIVQHRRNNNPLQRSVNPSMLEHALKKELEGESVLSAVELSGGAFNLSFEVKTHQNTYLLKIAPDANAPVLFNERALMRREQSLSDTLQSCSPLVPLYGSFFQIDGRDAELQEFVEGELWDQKLSQLSEEENQLLWRQLGAFARELHSHEGDQYGYPDPMPLFNSWSDFIKYKVSGLLENCRAYELSDSNFDAFYQHTCAFSDRLDEVQTPALLHGDLWPKNVLISGSGEAIRIAAVIDAERAFWGDPISDWVPLLYGVPEAFWEGYGQNLLAMSDPIRVAIYKGMYFIVNILESARAREPDTQFRHLLQDVNTFLSDNQLG